MTAPALYEIETSEGDDGTMHPSNRTAASSCRFVPAGITGSLVRLDAGSRSSVWGADSAGVIYRYSNIDATPWVKVLGSLSDIGVGG
ncbi:tectonin domain-containing protein [Streptomyces sp. NPDC017082]|uniref:tectonin domain-containing protein n=1 Tax=Streptomyces sp. NPDC017082 TaxID=3364974 RepID=UPI00379A1EA3